MMEDGIGIEVDADIVLLENFGNNGRLLPRCATVNRGDGVDIIVLVSVNASYTWSANVEDASNVINACARKRTIDIVIQ